jgi:hypothetical protein
MALGILHACYVSWLHQDWIGTLVKQVMLETCRGP